MFKPFSTFVFIMILAGHPFQTNKDFIFHFDNRDSLVTREESKSSIMFIVNRHKRDSGPKAFIYQKRRLNHPDTLATLAGLDLQYRDNIIKLLNDYYVILKEQAKTGTITLFEKWMESQFNSLFVVERKGDFYIKYPVTLVEIEVDYEF